MSGLDTPQFTPDDPNADQGATGKQNRGKQAGKKDGRSSQASRQQAGDWFGTMGQLDFDVDFFEKLLARNDHSVEVLRVLGEIVSRKGLLTRAVEIDRRLVELLPADFLARYNFGCSLARAGQAEYAIDELATAIELGYDDLAHMEGDPDLESLRERTDFQTLIDRD